MKNIFSCLVLVGTLFIFNKIQSEQIGNEANNELVFVQDVEQEPAVTHVDKIEVSDDIFIATSEWQTIKKNQGIPRGLHVRLNVQTGEKEAKLLDNSENLVEKTQKVLKQKQNSYEKLKEALKDLNDEQLNKEDGQSIGVEQQNKIKNKFRSYDEIKTDLGELNLNMNTDSELLQQLITQFNSSTVKADKLKILNDLEYFVHQFDNGVLFCDFGGFDLIMKELNTTIDSDLKAVSALVLGSAIQANSKVKVHAMKSDFLHMILRILSKSMSNNADLQNLVSKLLFTLSGLLRNFPFAQSQFLRFGGIETFNKLLAEPFFSVKTKAKVLALVNDLVLERIEAVKLENYDENESSKYQQYFKVNLKEKLIETDWCKNFEAGLLNKVEDHDSLEKIIDSILNLAEDCKTRFELNLKENLNDLKQKYTEISRLEEESNEDDYFLNLLKKIEKIIQIFKNNKKVEL